MKTIEERADEYAKTRCSNIQSELHKRLFIDAFSSSYIQGAKEQRKIDIDKACEWLKDNIKNYLCTSVRSSGGLNKEVIIDISRDCYYDFKKAMEE